MNPIALLVVAVGALGLWASSGSSTSSEGTSDGGAKATGMALATGLKLANNGIRVNQRQTVWLIRLRNACSRELVPEIVCTSGIRSYESQTNAMLVYLADQGEAKFRKLYEAAALDLLAAPARTRAAWLPIVTAAYQTGKLSKAGHLAGGAVDIRHRDLTVAQRVELERAAKVAGALKFYDDGPAYHADIPELA